MMDRSRRLAVQFVLVVVLTVASAFAATPGDANLYVATSALVGISLIALLAVRGERVRGDISRPGTWVTLLIVAVVMSLTYVSLFRNCVVRSRQSAWKDSPVYFPLFDPEEIARDITRSGTRQQLVEEGGPAVVIGKLDRCPGIDMARGLTTVVILAAFEFAFAASALLVSLWAAVLLGAVEIRSPGGAPPGRFKVALTFPGEHRKLVEEVAEYLARDLGREHVFYDRWHEAELARRSLHKYLKYIYENRSDLLVVFLCADYEKKDWCRLEWGAIRGLIDARDDDRIMLIRLDDGAVTGIIPSDGYLSVEGRSTREIAGKIAERLALLEGAGAH